MSGRWLGRSESEEIDEYDNDNEVLIYRTYHRSLTAVYNSFQA